MNLQIYVAAKSGNQLTLRALDGTSSFSLNLPANSTIVRLGIGVGEIKGSVDSRYVLPTIQYNFHQKFMATLRISRVRMDLATYDTNTWVRNLERALDDFRSTQELALLRGRRAERAEGGDKIYYMGGIEEFASKTITYSGSLSYNNLISWAEQIFADNNGSPERLLFAGSGVMADLMALPPFSNTLVNQEVEVRDIRFQRLVTNWGTLLVAHHPLLDEIGQRNTAYVVDLAQITKKVFRPLETTEVNVYQSGGDDLFEVRMQEISTLIVAMPDAHAVIRKN
ncbi:MAG: hypothetical protein N2561_07430 [Bacteroidetes bacterium]|nr:hypothetical protein [Rhodothermia bacterium]MCX7907349.1 hypothetical protein [Bacteroidota bacterium]MDW8286224.1 hypothetical protein [Bacteroidota bacterium]